MENSETLEDFAERCGRLEYQLKKLMVVEDSPRVWVAVLTCSIAAFAKMESNPEAAFQQAINVIKIWLKEE